jgi:uncharacterized surface protein with fasciclin (FAS1) repeats
MSHYAALPRAVALAVPITLGAWTVQAADIIQTAEQVGRFNGFLQLLEAADMVEMLKGKGPFTVFAPIDEAFGQLPPGTFDGLLAEENRKPLEAVIQSHMVAKEEDMCAPMFRVGFIAASRDRGTAACPCRQRSPERPTSLLQ